MNMNLVEIACVVDRSGSMESICSDAIGGFNSFLANQKAQPGSTKLTLVLFDNEYLVIHNGTDIQEVDPLNEQTFVPRGSTALLDAIGKTIADMGQRLSQTPEKQRPGKVILTILTDGEENASQAYSAEKVAEMIRHQQEKYQWEVVFLAANQDAVLAAEALAIKADDAIAFQASPEGVRHAMSEMCEQINYRRPGHQATRAKGKK